MMSDLRNTLLNAQSEGQALNAFHPLFALYREGDLRAYDDLLSWAAQSSNLCALHPFLIVSLLRIPYAYQNELDHWQPLLCAAHEEFHRRGLLIELPEPI